MRTLQTLVTVLVAGALASCGGGSTNQGDPVVMTWNLYYGADLEDAMLAVAMEDPEGIVAAVTEAWATVGMTDFSTRVVGIADQIVGVQPDLVAVQEASLWRSQYPSDAFTAEPTPATTVEVDMLAMLLEELTSRGHPYRVVALAEGFDAEFPRMREDMELEDIRLTDRDAILVRVRPLGGSIRVDDVQGGNFETNVVMPNGFEILCNWLSVDVEVRGQAFRFVSAHLEESYAEVQVAQVMELLEGPCNTSAAVVLVGDFNTDALAEPLPDAYQMLVTDGGLTDAWLETHPGEPGATWGHGVLLDDPTDVLTERLDFVFVSPGVRVRGVGRVGEDPADRVGGLWPSDHAGLAARVHVGR